MALINELDSVYRRCRQELFSYALAVTRCPAGAEDAIHTAFARTLALNQVPRDLKTYIFRAVRNAAIDSQRARRHIVPVPEGSLDSCIYDMHLLNLENAEMQQAAARAVQALPDEEREVIIAHLHADLTFREIADIAGQPLGTVASWYRRGLEKLRNAMEVNHGQC